MPAVSKAQRRLFAMALQYKKGNFPEDQASDEIKQLSKLPTKELELYAKTPEEDLPKHTEESMSYKNFPTFEQFVNESWGSHDKELKGLKSDIDKILKDKGLDAKTNVFHSGYDGLSIDIPGYNRFMILDQPGHVGLEDQSMGYIQLTYGGGLGSPYIVYYSPDYFKSGFGRTEVDDKMRKKTYADIISFFEDLPTPEEIKKSFISVRPRRMGI